LLFVGGSHLAFEHGKTIKEIKTCGFTIHATFDFLLNDDTPHSLAKSCAISTYEIANIFQNFDFEFVCILGDRFELLSIIQNAVLFRKLIIHIHGGEKSEGAIDEQIRHMITKSAHIHFVVCNEYYDNVRKLGESEWRIVNTGALAIDSISTLPQISKQQLFEKYNLDANDKVAILTYHPVTLENKITPEKQITNVFLALKEYPHQLIITAPNCDSGRDEIVTIIESEVKNNSKYRYIESLGQINYLSMIPYCSFIIGNSSSGIIEVPYFKIPTINIGNRQKGRYTHPSIIQTLYDVESIRDGIVEACSQDFLQSVKNMSYHFGNGNAATKMSTFLENSEFTELFYNKKLDFPN